MTIADLIQELQKYPQGAVMQFRFESYAVRHEAVVNHNSKIRSKPEHASVVEIEILD